MGVSININGITLVHKKSNGVAIATVPDVCKTPTPGGPVPMPYPNIARSSSLSKGSKRVKVDGGNMAAIKGSEFSRSNGDEAGTAGGGIKSSTQMKEATWLLYSFDVKIEGKNACRLTDKMQMNHGNTVCLAGVIQKALGLSDTDFRKKCKDCGTTAGDEIAWSKKMQNEYADAYKVASKLKPKPTGQDVEHALAKSLTKQGIVTQTAGTTDSQGNVVVKKQAGPCADLKEMGTNVHENVHKQHTLDLQKKFGKNTPAFKNVWNDGKDWADDEVNAYGAGEKFWKDFKSECKAAGP